MLFQNWRNSFRGRRLGIDEEMASKAFHLAILFYGTVMQTKNGRFKFFTLLSVN